MMGLRGWVTGERHIQNRIPENKGPEGVVGEGREEEGVKDWSLQQSRLK